MLLNCSSIGLVWAVYNCTPSTYQENWTSASSWLTSTTTHVTLGVREIMRMSLGFGGKRKTDGAPRTSAAGGGDTVWGQHLAWGAPGHPCTLVLRPSSGHLFREEGQARLTHLGMSKFRDRWVWGVRCLQREHTGSLGVGRAQGWAQVRVRSWYIPEQLVLLGAQGRGRGPACAHPGLSEVPS